MDDEEGEEPIFFRLDFNTKFLCFPPPTLLTFIHIDMLACF
jgi:hypothetical protein